MATATMANGCFWCTEAVFQRLRGVESVKSGYTGGERANPTYEEVCSGRTGHAEAALITFDPAQISYEDLLHVFFKTHDPTTLNRQGADVGTQYRSAIFYHDEDQKETVERVIRELTEAKEYSGPIVTQVAPAGPFYGAEDYHDNYYDRNRQAGYCRVVIDPKIQKLYEEFSGALATTT